MVLFFPSILQKQILVFQNFYFGNAKVKVFDTDTLYNKYDNKCTKLEVGIWLISVSKARNGLRTYCKGYKDNI